MLNKKFFTICLFILLMLSMSVSVSLAEETADSTSPPEAEETVDPSCINFSEAADEQEISIYCPYIEDSEAEDPEEKQFLDFIKQKQTEFQVFLEQHFQSKQPNSVLLSDALARYREIKAQIKEVYDLSEEYLLMNGCTQTETFDAIIACESMMTEELDKMYEPLKTHVRSTANVKRTTILLDKYKSINSKLRDMNGDLAETLGYYLTFSNKFQSFIPECVQ